MKWKGFFLVFTLPFCFITAARGQLINLTVKNERLEKVFLLIEQQSDYHFIYTTEQLANAKPVTLSVTSEPLTAVLDKCFAGQPLQYNINDKNITIKEKKITASGHPLKGRIIDQQGNPLKAVTISIKYTPLITVSDANGEFGFDNAPPDAILVITSVEIEPMERFVGSQRQVEIRVAVKVGLLDETVVIAYGKSTRRMSTGTVSSVKKDEIAKQPISNPLAALAGRVSGLQVIQGAGTPGAFYTLRLRGQNSIASGNDPLVVIDGIPFPSGTLNGSFGGGGGVTNSALNNLNPADIESIEVLKDADATAIYGSRAANGAILITMKKGTTGPTRVELQTYAGAGKLPRRLHLLNTKEYLLMRREAFAGDGITPNASNARDLLLWDTTRYTDWQKELIGETMHLYDARVSVSGGTGGTQFLFGTQYHKETTVIPGSFGEEKTGANLSVTHRSDDKRWLFRAEGSYLHNNNLLPQGDISASINLPPNAPELYHTDGSLNWENSTWSNPLANLRKLFRTNSDNLIANTLVSYTPVNGLEIKASFGFNQLAQREHITIPISSSNPAFNPTGSAAFGNNTRRTFIAEPQVSYQFEKSRTSVQLLAGYTFQSSSQQALYQVGSGYQNDELLGSLSAASFKNISNETDIRYRYLGFFGRATLDYAKKYILSLNARRDGSSRYGPENRFASFGSMGVAWIASNEKWLKKSTLLSFAKLKASAGITGNDQIGDFRFLDNYSPYFYTYQGIPTFQPVQLYNPDYGWEKVTKLEAGMDLGFRKDRYLLSLNYYFNRTTNQLILYPLPTLTGFSGVTRNLPAEIHNTGIELELTGTLIAGSRFNWNMSFNLSVPRNKLKRFDGLASSSYANSLIIGQPLFIDRRYQYAGIDLLTGLYTFTDVNRDNAISIPADLASVVNTGQQYYGGLQQVFSYKQIRLSVLLQFARQKNAVSYFSRYGPPGSFSNQPAFVMNRWSPDNSNAKFQRFTTSSAPATTAYYNFVQSNGAYSDASFIRFRSMELSWTIPFQKRTIKECVAFLQGYNLYTITAYKGLDPETKSVLPPAATLVIGARFTF